LRLILYGFHDEDNWVVASQKEFGKQATRTKVKGFLPSVFAKPMTDVLPPCDQIGELRKRQTQMKSARPPTISTPILGVGLGSSSEICLFIFSGSIAVNVTAAVVFANVCVSKGGFVATPDMVPLPKTALVTAAPKFVGANSAAAENASLKHIIPTTQNKGSRTKRTV
jgi:hypothetical protein